VASGSSAGLEESDGGPIGPPLKARARLFPRLTITSACLAAEARPKPGPGPASAYGEANRVEGRPTRRPNSTSARCCIRWHDLEAAEAAYRAGDLAQLRGRPSAHKQTWERFLKDQGPARRGNWRLFENALPGEFPTMAEACYKTRRPCCSSSSEAERKRWRPMAGAIAPSSGLFPMRSNNCRYRCFQETGAGARPRRSIFITAGSLKNKRPANSRWPATNLGTRACWAQGTRRRKRRVAFEQAADPQARFSPKHFYNLGNAGRELGRSHGARGSRP